MSLRLGISIGVVVLTGVPAAAQLTITNASPLPYGSLNSSYSVQLNSHGRWGELHILAAFGEPAAVLDLVVRRPDFRYSYGRGNL